MSKKALGAFFAQQIAKAKKDGVLFSLHLKATMMKVSDPIMFGLAVRVFLKDLFAKHAATFATLGVDLNNGFGDLVEKIQTLPADQRAAIEADIKAVFAARPAVAMVNSEKGITNLHVPSDVIVDASMPAMIRTSAERCGTPQGKLQDTLCVIPDSCYAGVYADDDRVLQKARRLRPKDDGLRAQRRPHGPGRRGIRLAQQDLSDPPAKGTIESLPSVTTRKYQVSSLDCTHEVESGDIWRACQTKDAAVQDWVKLAVKRARLSNTPAIFWLDAQRAHDAQIIAKVKTYLAQHDTKGLDIKILPPAAACLATLERLKAGQDTISVTGNVLRDYLTDLFPILEVGTSAKMLSIVPLMNGGGLFETGAGGSAPKHVEQFLQENYLRWDSLGEFFALAASLEHLSEMFKTTRRRKSSPTRSTKPPASFLENDRSPGRKLGTTDNRGSHFYLALYWAQALAAQTTDSELKRAFIGIAAALTASETQITHELLSVQGKPVDIGGYYQPDGAV
jgi:isocitrate dehydrogenase